MTGFKKRTNWNKSNCVPFNRKISKYTVICRNELAILPLDNPVIQRVDIVTNDIGEALAKVTVREEYNGTTNYDFYLNGVIVKPFEPKDIHNTYWFKLDKDTYYELWCVAYVIQEEVVIKKSFDSNHVTFVTKDESICVYSIGEVDGYSWKLDGIWIPSCIMFRE